MTIADPRFMRGATLLFSTSLVLAVLGCSTEDGSATDDSSEINEGTGSIERTINPEIAAPKTDLIGAKMTDVYADAKGTLSAAAATKGSDGCTKTEVTDPKANVVVVARIQCSTSDVIRTFKSDGSLKSEHYDLNKDGKVDRFTGEDGAVVQYTDADCDGKIDGIIERVDKVKDFSLNGYDGYTSADYPKSLFLYRVREDRDRDGKFEHEKLTAKGTLVKPGDS
jgi:hypothetical protein